MLRPYKDGGGTYRPHLRKIAWLSTVDWQL